MTRFMEKLSCASCGAVDVEINKGILTCDFCHSQYYVRELKSVPRWYSGERPGRRDYEDRLPHSPYWVDGGVSFRNATNEPVHVVWVD